MKIAQVAPLYESVPPRLYGGTERIVSFLTEALVAMGHEVTLFASGDSTTKAKLRSITPEGLRLAQCNDPLAYHILQLQAVNDESENFDVIHFHTDYLHFPLSREAQYNHVTTLHGQLGAPELAALYAIYSDMPLVSISFSQRRPLVQAGWVANVYHGLPVDLMKKGTGEGGYAAFAGRISPEKGLDKAIAISARAGLPLKVAAKIDRADKEYYEQHIRHLMTAEHVEFIGEISDAEKGEFFGNAKVTLFPINWQEPFGLVMIESLACGTPVIAFDRGSVSEVLDHGTTGFLVNTVDEAVDACARIDELSRDTCRRIFEERFSATRMAHDYAALYERMYQQHVNSHRLPPDQADTSNMDSILTA